MPDRNKQATLTEAKPTDPAIDTAERIADAVAKGIKGAQGLYKASRKPLEPPNYRKPDDFDVKAEADRIAKSKGHGPLSQWHEVYGDPATAQIRAEDPQQPKRYRAMCLTCKGKLTAMWHFRLTNDPVGTAEGKVSVPSIGGNATQKTCAQVIADRTRNKRQQTAQFLPRGSAGATGQVG